MNDFYDSSSTKLPHHVRLIVTRHTSLYVENYKTQQILTTTKKIVCFDPRRSLKMCEGRSFKYTCNHILETAVWCQLAKDRGMMCPGIVYVDMEVPILKDEFCNKCAEKERKNKERKEKDENKNRKWGVQEIIDQTLQRCCGLLVRGSWTGVGFGGVGGTYEFGYGCNIKSVNSAPPQR